MIATLIPNVSRRTWRRASFLFYDAVAICAALTIAVLLRMNGAVPPTMLSGMIAAMPVFLASGLVIFHVCGVYDRVWRLCSMADLTALIEAATLSIFVPIFVLLVTGSRWLPTSVPFIQWFVLVALLAAGRMWRKVLADWTHGFRLAGSPSATSPIPARQRALIVGVPENVERVLRQLEATPNARQIAVGILDVSDEHVAQRLRRIPILGGIDAIDHVVGKLAARNERPTSLIIAEGTKGLSGAAQLKLVTAAEMLGLSVLRAPPPPVIGQSTDFEAINLADLLGRPQTTLDKSVVSRAIKGQSVLVTGAGGTIGRELVRQIATFEPSEIILLDSGEFNLYSIELELRENYPDLICTPQLCSIRQRQHVMAAFEKHRPAFVFHAAALKHVPLVEKNICAGVLTNVLGTRNVADAARRFGALAMVQVSTDKAVNPVGIMGATKRLGELYCQALDIEGIGLASAARFVTVRFGNVLGSSGSLIPLFQRQLKRRAPLTVTHPDITRYFMTVYEAVQLVLHSMARAMECDVKRGRIIVLDMGEPVKVIDVAKRMIRLAGLEPGRDVPIEIVGLRPGEKLYEELFDEHEERLPSALPGVFEAEPVALPLSMLGGHFDLLAGAIAEHDEEKVRTLLFGLLQPESRATVEIVAQPAPQPAHESVLVGARVPALAVSLA
jgi:O-antigen biosynthesis protein WbqV